MLVTVLERTEDRLNRFIELFCALLLACLVCTVWLGIVARHVPAMRFTFTEELSRYLMIWTALFAAAAALGRRQHVALTMVFDRLGRRGQLRLRILFDVLGFVFFAVIFVYGLNYVGRGFRSVTMIYGIPRAYPLMVIPVSAALSCLNLALALVLDLLALGRVSGPETSPEASLETSPGPSPERATVTAPEMAPEAGPGGLRAPARAPRTPVAELEP